MRKKEEKETKVKRVEKNKKNVNSTDNKRKFNIKNICLKDTTRTIILVVILFVAYFLLNWGVSKINFAQIDFTKDKLYTLSDTSKNAMKSVTHDTVAYIWGYNEDSTMVDLFKQYNQENDKITYKVVNKDEDASIVEEYMLEDDYPVVIIKSDLKTKYIYDEDTYTYDESFNIVDVKEQKITNSILDANMEEKPKVYFVEGKSNYSLTSGMSYLNKFLNEELLCEVESANLITHGTVPEDCYVLAIMSLSTDLTDVEYKAIENYVNGGGNLFIAKDIRISDFKEFPNFEKVLALYGLKLPNRFVVETEDGSVAGSYGYIQAQVTPDHEITRLIYNANAKPLLYYPGVLEVSDSETLASLKTTVKKLVYSSSKATAVNPETKEQEDGEYTLGVTAEKVVSDGVISKAVVFSSSVSFSDAIDSDIGLNAPMVQYPSNYNLVLNSFAYLTSRGELYSIRKSSAVTQYMPTEGQDRIVRGIIICVPLIVVGVGFIIWMNRRKRN